MEKILKIALDAEQKAQNIIAQAKIEKARCDESIARADKIHDENIEKAKDAVLRFEEQERQKAQKLCKAYDKELEKSMKRLESLYETNGGQWVDKMYRQITEKL